MTKSGVMDVEYRYTAGQNNGRIAEAVDYITGEDVLYTYDSLNRLSTAQTTSAAWGNAYTYDGWGNLTSKAVTKGTAPSMTQAYDPSLNMPVGSPLPSAPADPFSYDAELRSLRGPGEFNSATGDLIYDPNGKKIFWAIRPTNDASSLECEIYFHSITGQRLARYRCGTEETWDDQGVSHWNFWMAVADRTQHIGGELTTWNGGAATTDRLGSVRARDNDRYTYYPYGEVHTSNGSNPQYAGLETPLRKYDPNLGRFDRPDPLGMGAVVMGDPGSWNRFAYAGGDPVNFTDPEGLMTCGDLPVEGGGTVSDALLADSDAGLLTRFVWAVGGTLAANGNSTTALGLSQELIAQAMMNRLSIANGRAAVLGRDGVVYWGDGGVQGTTRASILGYGSRGTTLAQEIVRAAAGTNEVNGAGELNDVSGLNRTLDTDLGDPTRALPGRIHVDGTDFYVTPECYRAISAMQSTNTILGGGSLNAPGFFVTSWKANGNSNPDPSRLYTLATVGGTTFFGFGAYEYARYPYPFQPPPRRRR